MPLLSQRCSAARFTQFPMFQCQGLPDSAFPSGGGEEQRALHEGRGILQHILLMLYLDCEGLVGVTLQRWKEGISTPELCVRGGWVQGKSSPVSNGA